MKVVLMAGEKGTRIQSIASDIPKPMISINEIPVLETELCSLREQGFTEFIFTVDYLADCIVDYFGGEAKRNVHIEYYREATLLGNAGALFKLNLQEDFLLIIGDAIFDIDFNRMVGYHKEKGGLVTLFTHPNSHSYHKLINKDFVVSNDLYHDPSLKQGVEGIEFNFRLLGKAKSAVFMNRCLYHYVYNEDSLSVVVSETTNKMLIKGYEKINYAIVLSGNLDDLYTILYDRIHFSIISTALRGYFNLIQKKPWNDRKKGMDNFLAQDIVNRSLRSRYCGEFSFSRKVTLFLIRGRFYFVVSIIAILSNYRLKKMKG